VGSYPAAVPASVLPVALEPTRLPGWVGVVLNLRFGFSISRRLGAASFSSFF